MTGSDDGEGYLRITLKGTTYKTHRLAFLYMTGEMPIGMVDHINGDKADNRWENLIDCNHYVNQANRKNNRENVGVTFSAGKHIAYMSILGKKINLSYAVSEHGEDAAYFMALTSRRIMEIINKKLSEDADDIAESIAAPESPKETAYSQEADTEQPISKETSSNNHIKIAILDDLLEDIQTLKLDYNDFYVDALRVALQRAKIWNRERNLLSASKPEG